MDMRMQGSASTDTRHCYSKGEAERLLRKLIVLHVLVEETFRQDNQYQSVSSALRVNDPVAARLASGRVQCSPVLKGLPLSRLDVSALKSALVPTC